MSDAVDGSSAARSLNTIVRQNVTFPQIPLTLGCGASHALRSATTGGRTLAHHFSCSCTAEAWRAGSARRGHLLVLHT
eukprot:6544310-Prymnesium_polylepis.1